MKLRMLSYNIRYGGAGREKALTATIRKSEPDLVIFQEALLPAVIEKLASETGMTSWAARPGQSVGFMSRLPIFHYEWHRPWPCRQAFLELVLAGSEARVFGVHLSALHLSWMERQRTRELRALLARIRHAQQGFHVLTGDFNTLAPGAELDWRRLPRRLQLLGWLGGRTIHWQTVQLVLDAHYRDGYRALHPDTEGHTFPTWNPHVRLDYLFVPESGLARVSRCDVVDGADAKDASDHFPLLAELEV